MGEGDHKCHEGHARIATERTRDRHDRVIVTEKLDGSCCAVANIDGQICALGRSGYLAKSSPYEQHQLFAYWVRREQDRFRHLPEGYRIVGEWLAQAHGTRYELNPLTEPFVVFDVFDEHNIRASTSDARYFASTCQLDSPYVIHAGDPISIERAIEMLDSGQRGSERHYGFHGATEPVEGAVWRVEREGTFDFMCKWVRPDKIDGKYLPEISGGDAVWNWRP
jgi:hypothetical protein